MNGNMQSCSWNRTNQLLHFALYTTLHVCLCVVGEPQFIADSCGQQLRKLVLELIHRLPTNDHLKGHVKVHWCVCVCVCVRERERGERGRGV